MNYVKQPQLKGQRVGVVLGAFAPLHQGHLDVIMRAKKENDGGCVVIVSGYANDRGSDLMPFQKRYRYVREYFVDDPLVAVYAIDEDELGIAGKSDCWDEWLAGCDNFITSAAEGELVWYVGEPEYQKALKERGYETVLLNRAENPISATMIRQNPVKYWDKIAYPFRRVFSHNILITGTASEGKTTLTADLGKYFNAPYSHEYAIDYIKESCIAEWELDGTDYIAFLDGQYNLNKSLINSRANHGIFFSDTDAIVTKMYAEFYAKDPSCAITEEEYKKVADLAEDYIKKAKWDKIFLLAPKEVFIDDGIRYMKHSNMASRNTMFDILCRELVNAGLWDKVVVLQDGYYGNFTKIVEYTKGVIKNGKA